MELLYDVTQCKFGIDRAGDPNATPPSDRSTSYLDWNESKSIVDQVKSRGINQFVRLYNLHKDRQSDWPLWTERMDYQMVKFDDESKRAYGVLRGSEVLSQLVADDSADSNSEDDEVGFVWSPKYAEYILQGTTATSYGGAIYCFDTVENNMRRRRAKLEESLVQGETVVSIPLFPLMGHPHFVSSTTSLDPSSNEYSQSLFIPDDAISSVDPRFKNLARNIRQRRGGKVLINVPVYKDTNTPSPFRQEYLERVANEDEGDDEGDDGGPSAKRQRVSRTLDDHVYMDATGFGMGGGSMVLTFQATSLDHARRLHDHLTPISPIILAMTAATPIYRGYLSDIDARWNVTAASVDDRTEAERGSATQRGRYDSVQYYIHSGSVDFNDVELKYDSPHFETLSTAGGIDGHLARYLAHLFAHDPLLVAREQQIDQHDPNNDGSKDFDAINSTIWRDVKLLPPLVDDPSSNWRVEFRAAEIQLTDFENAAFSCFVVLLARVIEESNLTMLIPISKVIENMQRAQRRQAVSNEKFHFRRVITPPNLTLQASSDAPESDQQQVVEMSIGEIVNGKSTDFPGLLPLIRDYLNTITVEVAEVRDKIDGYLTFIEKRANGELPTLALWMREFVRSHKSYRKNSILTEKINYDLLKTMDDIRRGRVDASSLLGEFGTNTTAASSIGDPQMIIVAEVKSASGLEGTAEGVEEAHNEDQPSLDLQSGMD